MAKISSEMNEQVFKESMAWNEVFQLNSCTTALSLLPEYRDLCQYFIDQQNPAFVQAMQAYERDIMLVLLKVSLLAFDSISEQFNAFMQKSIPFKVFNQGQVK